MKPEDSQQLLAWNVEVPGKEQTYTSWDRRPRGTLTIGNKSDGGEERITLPKQVARLLRSKKESGEVSPASRAELLYMVRQLEHSCARARIQRLIDRREYSTSEVRTKLQQDGYGKQTIDECLSRACEVGLISDRRFADNLIRSKIGAGWGTMRIGQELKRRGVDINDVPGWPYEYLDPEDEVERAVEVARRKRVSGARAYEKLVRHLCSRGYTTGVAARAARRLMDEDDETDLVDF